MTLVGIKLLNTSIFCCLKCQLPNVFKDLIQYSQKENTKYPYTKSQKEPFLFPPPLSTNFNAFIYHLLLSVNENTQVYKVGQGLTITLLQFH